MKLYFKIPVNQVAGNPSSGGPTVYHQIKGFCVWDTRVDGTDTKGLIRPLSHCFGDDMSLRPRLDHIRGTHTLCNCLWRHRGLCFFSSHHHIFMSVRFYKYLKIRQPLSNKPWPFPKNKILCSKLFAILGSKFLKEAIKWKELKTVSTATGDSQIWNKNYKC